jgi:hypothetical protein
LPIADERFARLFDQLVGDGFSDITGTDLSITLPVSKRLLNELVAAATPPSAPVRDLDLTPLDNDRFLLRGRIGSSALLPALRLNLEIDQQPVFPESPVLVVRLQGPRIMSLAGPLLRMISLPPWLRAEQDRLHVDLRVVAAQYRVDHYLKYIDELRVNAVAGTLVVSLRGRVR